MSDIGDPTRPAGLAHEPEGVLRAKYLDFCSAQVADILLRLTPDEIYVLAQDTAREAGAAGELSYVEIVELATRRVSQKLGLPSFEEWEGAYRKDPEQFEQYLLGLWESELETSADER